MITQAAIETVADEFYQLGQQNGWWPVSPAKSWREFDPAARQQFLALVKDMVEKRSVRASIST